MPNQATEMKPFSEVIFSTNEMVIAQCYKEDLTDKNLKLSVFQGATVRIESSYDSSHITYGIVGKINSSSLDSIHKPSALGLNNEQLEDLHPQVYDLLRKEIEIFLFAHKEKGNELLPYPPLKPMMIHDFVYETNNEEILRLTEDFTSLTNLIKKNQLKPDILVTLIKQGYILRNYDYSFLVKTGQELSMAFSDEVESLMQVLKRLSTITNSN